MSDRSVENMEIWKQSRLFVNAIYKMMTTCRDNGFKDQIQRASISIMNNIAEGFEGGGDAVFVRFLQIAKGSCSEVKSMLYLCEDLHFCTKEQREGLHAQLYHISSGIYKLIQYLNNKQIR